MYTSMSSPPPIPLRFEEASLAQVVLSTQRQTAEGEPQVLGSADLFLPVLCAAARAEGRTQAEEYFEMNLDKTALIC